MRPSALALLLVAGALVAIGPTTPGAGAPEQLPETVTRSYYMANSSAAAARNLGCLNGDASGRMILFFGAPTEVDGDYGATLWGAPDRATSGIAETVKEFARGYAWCRQSPDHVLLIGVGTSNSTIDGRADDWLEGHGRAWAGMARDLAGWAETHYPGRLGMHGAWDAEPSWSTFAKAVAWMDGYDGLGDEPSLYANFSADGCPLASSDDGDCNNGWTQQALWHLAWDRDPSLPLPQVYAADGANARQWHMIDLYGAGRGDGLHFFGVMSQHAACSRPSADCKGTDNTPEQARKLMLWFSNSHPATRQPSIDTSTDIDWHI